MTAGLVCLVAGLSVCQRNADTIGQFSNTQSLTGTRLTINQEQLNSPYEITLLDSLLIVEDILPLKQFQVINLFSGQVRQVALLGEGPNELTFPTSVQKLNRTKKIGLYIRPKFTYCEVGFGQFLNDSMPFDPCIKFITNYQRIVKVSDTVFVGTGIFNKRFAVSDKSGAVVAEMLDYPFMEKLSRVDPESLAMAHQGSLEVKPDGSRLVFAASMAVQFQIVKVQGHRVEPIKSFNVTFPKFQDDGLSNTIGVVFDPDHVQGFLDLSVNDEFIFALYSGRPQSEGRAASAIYVFSWEGDQVCKLLLDCDVKCIAVDEASSVLYAVESGDKPYLTEFKMNFLSGLSGKL